MAGSTGAEDQDRAARRRMPAVFGHGARRSRPLAVPGGHGRCPDAAPAWPVPVTAPDPPCDPSVEVTAMPKFLIEREVPGASALSPAELHAISRRSVGVLRQLGPEIQWVETYVAGNNLYCVYVAPDEEMIREHGRLGGFPVNKVSEVKTMIDPTTAE